MPPESSARDDDRQLREALRASRDPASFGRDILAAARETIDRDLRENRWTARTGRALREGAGDAARWMRGAFSRGRPGEAVAPGQGASAAGPGREAPGVRSGRRAFERMVRAVRAARRLAQWIRQRVTRRAAQPADAHGAAQPTATHGAQPAPEMPQPLAQRIMNRPVPGERYMQSLPPELGQRAAIAQAIELAVRQDPKLAALHADGRMSGVAQFLAAVDKDIAQHRSATPPLPAPDPHRLTMWGDETQQGIARAATGPAGDVGPVNGVRARAAQVRTARPDGVSRSASNASTSSAPVRRSSSSANTPRR
ncbi:hypothetical protein [Krasilnikovia sp. MM14-A1004]|uniref:hypothetical protein n=1 Tax=Krasilnikovia sp. MM14-A1004 TaxID=3373541 RepID=UPI00399D0034